MRTEIKAIGKNEKGLPDWENPDTLTFEDNDLYGKDWVVVTMGKYAPRLISISELKRVTKTL